MATIKGIKAGTTTITASYGGLSSSVTLTVTQIAGHVAYSAAVTYPNNAAGGAASTLYCTYNAAAASSTNVDRTLTISSGPTSNTGQEVYCSTTPSVKLGATSVNGWSVSSDGKKLTIPAGTPAGSYTVVITANATESTGYYNAASTTATITVSITATSISAYGNVSAPSVSQKTDFPAGGCTLSKSNAGTYYSTGTSSQTITYNNGATRTGNILYDWSGTSTSISSLGTTTYSNGKDVTINALTYTATGEGSKTNTGSTGTTGHQAENVENTSTHYSTSTGSATGDNWTYGTPTGLTKSNDIIILHGGTSSMQAIVNNNKQYWLKWSSGSYLEHNDTIAGSVAFAIDSVSSNHGNGSGVLTDYSLSGSTLTHYDIGTFVGTDTCQVYAYNNTAPSNSSCTSQRTAAANNLKWSLQNDRWRKNDGIKEYGIPTTITVSGSDTISASGGNCTVTSSVTNVRYWHYEYSDSNHNEPANTSYDDEAGTVEWVITAESTALSGDRWYNLSATTGNSTKVTHAAMPAHPNNATITDSLILVARNADDTTKVATAKSWSITSTRSDKNDGIKEYGIPSKPTWSNDTISVTGGSAVVSSSVTNVRYWHYEYTNTSVNEVANAREKNETGSVIYVTSSATPSGRWSLSGATVTHSSIPAHPDYANVTDTYTIVAKNAADNTKVSDASIALTTTSTRTAKDDGIKTWGTPSDPTLANNLTAGNGSVTISGSSVTNVRYWHYEYTNSAINESANTRAKNETGSVAYEISSQVFNSSTSITRFLFASGSNTTINHSGMGTNVGTDTVYVKAYNTGSNNVKSSAVSASVTNNMYEIKDGIKTWGKPTNPTLTNNLTAGNGTLVVSNSSVTNVRYWHYEYTDTNANEAAKTRTKNETGSVAYEISSQTFTPTVGAAASTTRFSFALGSNTTINHSGMGDNVGTDTVYVKAYNTGSTSTKSDAVSAYVDNVRYWHDGGIKEYGIPAAVTASNDTILAGGGTATLSSSVTNVRYWYYTYTDASANESATAHTENIAGTVGFKFLARTPDADSAWSISETTLSHRAMGTNLTTDSCTVVAYNTGLATNVGTGKTWSKTNSRSEVNDDIASYGIPTITIGSGITAAGGSALVTCGATNVRYWHYEYTDTNANEAANKRTKNEDGLARWRITSNGGSRFSHPTSGSSNLTISGTSVATYATGSSVSHSNMGTYETTDTVRVYAYNVNDTTKNNYADASAINEVIAIHLSLGSDAVSKSGNDATGHPSTSHYDLAYNASASTTVTADYSSGLTNQPFSKAGITSGDTNIVTVS